MKKTVFKNKTFFVMVLVVIGSCMLWNLYWLITASMMIAFLPVTIQSILVVLVLTRNQYAKIVFLIWAIVFLIIAFGFQFVGKLLMDAAHGFSNVDFLIYIKTGTGVIIGVLMTIFTMKTVEVKIIQADEKDNEVIN